MPRPVLYPKSNVLLPPRLCASVDYYAYAWQYGSYAQDWDMRFDKRDKETHRFTIADTRGPLQLTVPIAKPSTSLCRWSDIEISTHGAWWDVHRVALESAYGGSPYFEFYIDRFLPMLTVGVDERFPLLCQLAAAWDIEICNILGINRLSLTSIAPPYLRNFSSHPDIPVSNRLSSQSDIQASHVLFSQSDFVKSEVDSLENLADYPYYQVRADKLGFIPSLSILDLIFNLGPESPLYLNKISKQLT